MRAKRLDIFRNSLIGHVGLDVWTIIWQSVAKCSRIEATFYVKFSEEMLTIIAYFEVRHPVLLSYNYDVN